MFSGISKDLSVDAAGGCRALPGSGLQCREGEKKLSHRHGERETERERERASHIQSSSFLQFQFLSSFSDWMIYVRSSLPESSINKIGWAICPGTVRRPYTRERERERESLARSLNLKEERERDKRAVQDRL